jgi:YegS/Rv2252/BmrU family lipid kinase
MPRVPARSLVILNPRAAGGAAERRFARIEGPLRAALGPCEVERTRGPRDAERLAREAARAGVERIVVAGGDGTVGEVVTGLLSAGASAQLGLLPLGTGLDFARSAGVPRSLAGALAALGEGALRRVDAGRIQFRDPRGKEQRVGFANVASFGVSGLVVELVNRAPKQLGGRISFLIGTLRALLRFRCRPVTLRLDGATIFSGPLVLCAAANGGWFGGGMHVAPDARIDDGLLDVVVVGELSAARLAAKLPSLYRGRHLGDPAVAHFRGRLLEADAEPGAIPLEVDGDPLGTLPARIELLPGALTLFGAGAGGA